MANISEALQQNYSAYCNGFMTLAEARDFITQNKSTGFMEIGMQTVYLKNGIISEPPKSDYDLALEELNREFPGAERDEYLRNKYSDIYEYEPVELWVAIKEWICKVFSVRSN